MHRSPEKRAVSLIFPLLLCTIQVRKLFRSPTAFSSCFLLRFDAPDEAWLDFVCANRAGTYGGEAFDFIFGPVANDDVYTTFARYTAGSLSKSQTLEALKIKKLYNQLVLTSEKTPGYLEFVGTIRGEAF